VSGVACPGGGRLAAPTSEPNRPTPRRRRSRDGWSMTCLCLGSQRIDDLSGGTGSGKRNGTRQAAPSHLGGGGPSVSSSQQDGLGGGGECGHHGDDATPVTARTTRAGDLARCPAPGLMEALIKRKDASHGGTEEVPRRAAGAGHAHGRGGRRDPATRAGALARVAKQLSINPETLRNWVTQAEIDGGVRPGTTTRDAQRLLELERENRELRRANEIPKTASAFSPRRSSTADCSDRRLHRRTQRTTLRGRAGWGGAGGRRRQIDRCRERSCSALADQIGQLLNVAVERVALLDEPPTG